MRYIDYFMYVQILFDIYLIILFIYKICKLEQDTLLALKNLKRYIDASSTSVDDNMCVDVEEYKKGIRKF